MGKQIAGHQDAQLTWKETRRMHTNVQAPRSPISLCLFIFASAIFSFSQPPHRLDGDTPCTPDGVHWKRKGKEELGGWR